MNFYKIPNAYDSTLTRILSWSHSTQRTTTCSTTPTRKKSARCAFGEPKMAMLIDDAVEVRTMLREFTTMRIQINSAVPVKSRKHLTALQTASPRLNLELVFTIPFLCT